MGFKAIEFPKRLYGDQDKTYVQQDHNGVSEMNEMKNKTEITLAASKLSINIEILCGSIQELERIERIVLTLGELDWHSQSRPVLPELNEGMSTDEILRSLASYIEFGKYADSSGGILFSMVAIRSKLLKWDGSRWSGGAKLFRVYGNVLSKSSLSRACTVLLNEIPSVLQPSMSVDDASRFVLAWSQENNFWDAYDRNRSYEKTKRKWL